ncbi:MAG: phage baseplate protein [Paraclostridium sp.]
MIKLLCYEKEPTYTSIPDFELLLQAVTRFSVDSKNKVTKRRVETGFSTSDNTMNEPKTMTLSGSVGDINRNPDSLWTGMYGIPIVSQMTNKTYVESLWSGMNRIRDEKMFVVVYNTKNGKFYDNFVLTGITLSDSHKTTIGFDYSMNFQEIRISEIGEVSTVSTADNSPASDGSKGQGNIGANNNKYGESVIVKMGKRLLPK